MNFHLINFLGVVTQAAFPCQVKKSLIAKNSRSHKKPATKEEGSRNYLLPTALSFKHVEFFN
jgi:hypothetical protein